MVTFQLHQVRSQQQQQPQLFELQIREPMTTQQQLHRVIQVII